MSAGRSGGPLDDDHAGFDELAVGWALHALEPEDEDAFAVHLPGCARCAETVAVAAEVMAAMAADLPAAEPSAQVRDRLRSAVAETEQVRRPAVPAPAPAAATATGGEVPVEPSVTSPVGSPADPATWRRLLPGALVAAAFAAIVALGLWSVFLNAERDEAVAAAAAQAEIVDALLEPGRAAVAPVADDDGRTVATVIAREDRMQVVADGLTTNDTADSVYVVWGMRDGVPDPIGTFDVVDDRLDLRTVGSDRTGLDDYSEYRISIEPGRAAPSVPTEVVAAGEVAS
ncbi:anti-sigma factor [Blastococcus sp. CT_GayMR20]|uniref:anti-sigma factor domain-containing protein n=1 Tax=Blastococcus sp. CT_GayMR20 TaxID=2559609 RepID=UPI001073F315|nr:anti-sigma factor [Blastococcus sp. CT_GayMR20]TFV90263.1 anti-sigma factor [Blastococcus sp. CT_GayMR20]